MNERLILILAPAAAIIILIAGVVVAMLFKDPHAVNRSGSLIVAFEAVIVTIDYHLQKRLAKIPEADKKSNEFYEQEIDSAERGLFIIGVSMAVIGEILHGFGDLIYESMLGSLALRVWG